jgi:IclR family acetate operon transcriptional repressor
LTLSTGASVQPKRDLLQTVQRACRILHLIAERRVPLTVREISEALGLNTATCYHLLNTLESEGFIQRDSGRLVRLGHRIGELHDAFETMLRPDTLLLEQLESLNSRTGETSYLGVWDGDDVVSVAVREGRGGVRVQGLYLGYRGHGYARALARALLSHASEEFVDAYLRKAELEELTERTETDPNELKRLLRQARDAGLAIEEEEFTPGVCCIAAAVFAPDGEAIAALSVSVPRARFDSEGRLIGRIVAEEAQSATKRLRVQDPLR